jgi:beta-glucosidase
MTDLLEDVVEAPRTDAAALAERFPESFVWGVASSAYQIEGAVAEDGRRASIWDLFSHTQGRTANGETGDIACDHYHRWAEDVELIASLGASAYRFSVSWPRVLPTGSGSVNERGIAFYDRLVDRLLERGIEPVVTLYHWDLPQALQDRGGWANPAMVDWFADYAGLLAQRLGDRVRTWITINEPQCFTFMGYGSGEHAPGLRDWGTALQVSNVAIAAHWAAAARIRASAVDPRVGVALDLNLVEPASTSAADVEAARRHRAIRQDWFLDPLFGRGYPELAMAAHRGAGHLPAALLPPPPGELDFLGLNYYTRETVAADATAPFGLRLVSREGAARTTMDWEIYPDGLRQVLLRLQREYAPAAIVVTESGAAFADGQAAGGRPIADPLRRDYLADHLSAAAQAIEAGVPLTGYHAWSLLDNFEWERGYGQRFGLIGVDYETQRRTLKESGVWYRELLAAHRTDR